MSKNVYILFLILFPNLAAGQLINCLWMLHDCETVSRSAKNYYVNCYVMFDGIPRLCKEACKYDSTKDSYAYPCEEYCPDFLRDCVKPTTHKPITKVISSTAESLISIPSATSASIPAPSSKDCAHEPSAPTNAPPPIEYVILSVFLSLAVITVIGLLIRQFCWNRIVRCRNRNPVASMTNVHHGMNGLVPENNGKASRLEKEEVESSGQSLTNVNEQRGTRRGSRRSRTLSEKSETMSIIVMDNPARAESPILEVNENGSDDNPRENEGSKLLTGDQEERNSL